MSLRDKLRALPSIVGTPPTPFPSQARDPRALLLLWLQEAIDNGIPEPHAITLSTVDAKGHPDSRVLIIKDITLDFIIEIASSSRSPKGQQMLNNPFVSLCWYCSPHARQIRIRGSVSRAPEGVNKADFKARGAKAKAVAMAGTQSTPTGLSKDSIDAAVASKTEELSKDPDMGEDAWAVWRIEPSTVEFWQGSEDRCHDRLQFSKGEGEWTSSLLWP
jgi:pyridoxamine 5'-phosphate oxidase